MAAQTEQPDFSYLTTEHSYDDFLPYAEALSTYFARRDGSRIPPYGEHFDRAAKEGWGVNGATVRQALGSIVPLQEALGFVMPSTYHRWSRATFLEHGLWMSHVQGSPEHPMPPDVELVKALSKLCLSPGYPTFIKEFNSWNNYLDELGYVSQTTLRRWSDQDWIDNGIWLTHMAGSPDEPAVPTAAVIREATRAKICPNHPAVIDKFGSLNEYRRRLGFEEYGTILDYASWDRDTYIQNGTWFSHVLGTPESPRAPDVPALLRGAELGLSPGITPITRVFGGIPAYQDALGFVSRYTLEERWTYQDWIDNGRWLGELLGKPGPPRLPRRRELEHAFLLHLGPSWRRAREKFGSYTAYARALDLPIPTYEEWTDRAILQRGLAMIRERSGELPSKEDYRNVDGPTQRVIIRRFGSLSAFYERMGTPGFVTWDDERLINFGLQWALAHEDTPPQAPDLLSLRAKGAAPTLGQLEGRFGSITAFQFAVVEALPAYHMLADSLAGLDALSAEAIHHLLREFRPGEAYAQERQQVARILVRQYGDEPAIITELLQTFGESRVTLDWEQEDFIAFGRLAFAGQAAAECLRRLAVLNLAGLCPEPQDISDVFGSLQEFVEAVTAEPAPEQAP